MNLDELNAKLRESERVLFDARMQLATGQLANTSLLWKTRKEISWIKTLAAQKQQEAQAAQ